MNNTLTDVFYTILLGLDGCASIGGIQETYDLKDENGNQLSGEIEGYAYEYFHEQNAKVLACGSSDKFSPIYSLFVIYKYIGDKAKNHHSDTTY